MKEIAIISCPGVGSVDDCIHLARQFTSSVGEKIHCTVFGCLPSSKVGKFECATDRAYVIRLLEEEDWRVGPITLSRPNLEPPHRISTSASSSEQDEPATEATSEEIRPTPIPQRTPNSSAHPLSKRPVWHKSPKDFLLSVLRATKVLELTDYIDLVILEVKGEDHESLIKLYNAIHDADRGWSRRMIIYFLRRSENLMEGVNIHKIVNAPTSPETCDSPDQLQASETVVNLKHLETPSLVFGDSFVCADLPVAKYYKAPCWSFHPNASWYQLCTDHLLQQMSSADREQRSSLAKLVTAFKESVVKRAGLLTWTTADGLEDFKRVVQIQFQPLSALDGAEELNLLRVDCHVNSKDSFVASVKTSATMYELDMTKTQISREISLDQSSNATSDGAAASTIAELFPYLSGQEPTAEFGAGLISDCNSFADVLMYPIIAAPTSPLQICNSFGLVTIGKEAVIALPAPPAFWESKLGGISVEEFLREHLTTK